MGVFVLIDSRHPPQKIDLEFVQWLARESVAINLVFTKSDQSKPAVMQKNIELFQENIAGWFDEMPEVFPCSSVTGHGMPQLLGAMEEILNSHGLARP